MRQLDRDPEHGGVDVFVATAELDEAIAAAFDIG